MWYGLTKITLIEMMAKSILKQRKCSLFNTFLAVKLQQFGGLQNEAKNKALRWSN